MNTAKSGISQRRRRRGGGVGREYLSGSTVLATNHEGNQEPGSHVENRIGKRRGGGGAARFAGTDRGDIRKNCVGIGVCPPNGALSSLSMPSGPEMTSPLQQT